MKRKTLISFALVLSILGLADAWYLAETALTGTALTCTIAGLEGCNVVAQSSYSHFFGIPLGLYGVVFYAAFLVLAAFAFWKPSRAIDAILAALGLIGLLTSAYFIYIQVALIKAVCIYCLASAGVAFLLFVVVTWLLSLSRKETAEPLSPSLL